jgi:hypothetical protein
MNWPNAGEAKYATTLLIKCIFHSYPILKKMKPESPILKNEAYHLFLFLKKK